VGGASSVTRFAPEIRRLCTDTPATHRTNEALELIRTDRYSLPHAVGTCPMGPRPDGGAVVDDSGRIQDNEALSGIDALIMPDVLARGPGACRRLAGSPNDLRR
jgi:choline dehydrogenase-like flavoprotein